MMKNVSDVKNKRKTSTRPKKWTNKQKTNSKVKVEWRTCRVLFKPAVLSFSFFLFFCVFFLASSSSNCDPFLISMSSWLSQQIINIACKPSISTPAILPRVSRKAEWQGEWEFRGWRRNEVKKQSTEVKQSGSERILCLFVQRMGMVDTSSGEILN